VKVTEAHFLSHGAFSEKLVQQSVSNLEAVYKAAGYSDTKVIPETARGDDGNLSITFTVDEGPLTTVNNISLQGNTVPESELAPKGLKLGAGKPYSQELLETDRNEIIAKYLAMGYLNASFQATADPAGDHKVNVVYKITEGPKVDIARVMTVGRKDTRDSLITTTAALKHSKPLTETDMLSAESRLYNLGIFDWAEVDPRERITTQTNEDVLIKVHEAKQNSITYGFGFEVINRGGSVPSGTVAVPGIPPVGLPQGFRTSQKTFWGPRGSVEYTRSNLRGRAETLTLATAAGRLSQRGSVSYAIPYFRNSAWNVSSTVLGEHNSENPIFTSRQGQFGFQFQRNLDAKGTKSVFLRYSFQLTALSNLLIPELVPPSDQHVRLSTVEGTFLRDTRDNPLDAHRGIFESFEIGFNPSFLGSDFSYARFLGQTAYYKQVGAGIIWANNLRIGLESAFGNSRVPLSETFFTGGGSTLRGYPLNGAGPQRTITACGDPADPSTCGPITVPVGGKQLFIVNSEFRVPINYNLPFIGKNLGVVGFYDGGNVYTSVGLQNFASNFTHSVGFGVRYATPVGPVRIDIGHALDAPPGIKSTQIFVTLGQAF
jgi:outer membrane protein assembly factor BamA